MTPLLLRRSLCRRGPPATCVRGAHRDRAQAIHRLRNLPAPTEGFVVTHFLTVRSVAKSRSFYSEVLGGQVVLEENPCMIKLYTRG